MSLADAARAARVRRGPTCDTGLLLDRLPESDRRELQEALEDPLVQSTALARVLTERQIPVSYWSLQRHRRGDCQCR